MGIEQAIVRPPRCFLVNVTTAASFDCLFNPTQLSEKVQVNWNRIQVPGLSHQVLQYQGTGNRQLSSVEFYLDKLFADKQSSDTDIMEFRRFLRALTVPPENTEGVPATAPPRVLFVWPGVLSLETVLTEVEFQYRQFGVGDSDLSARVLVYTATCSFEEILDVRVTSEHLRQEAF
jgi:hypothetical protein